MRVSKRFVTDMLMHDSSRSSPEASLHYSLTSNIEIDGWCMVHTTVRPVLTVFLTALMTMAAARASRPE